VTSGRSSGKEVAMTFLNSSRAQIKENRCACGKAIGLLGAVNIFLNGELHCFHYDCRGGGGLQIFVEVFVQRGWL